MTRDLHNFSPTQYEAFTKRCKRYWHFRWVMRRSEPEEDHQKRGKDIHKQIENRSNTGVIETHDYAPYVRAVEATLPPLGSEFYTELPIEMPTHLGIPWKGVIDLLWPTPRPIDLRDYKTVSESSFRRRKTPAQIYDDIQLGTYAEFVFKTLEEQDVDHGGLVRAGLHYIQTVPASKPIPKKPKTDYVFADLSRADARRIWLGTRSTLDEMVEVAQCDDPNEVEPNSASCDLYPPKGCPFRNDCGVHKTEHTFNLTNPKPKENLVSYLNKIKGGASAPTPSPANGAASETPAPAQQTQPAAGKSSFVSRVKAAQAAAPVAAGETQQPPAFSIVPSDAPARTAGGAETEVKSEAKPEPTEVVVTDDAAATDEKKSRGRGRPKGSTAAKGFTIYVDCILAKGGGDVEPTHLDDWFGPLEMELNEVAQKEGDKPHWMMLGFGDQKALLSMKVQERIAKGLPQVMLVSSSSNAAREVLPMLLPHATQVIRALRG